MDTKPFYTSKTFWGVIIMLVAAGVAKFGYVVDDSLQNDTAEAIVFIVGTIIALIGRWRAAKPLSVSGDASPRYVPLLLVACLLCLTAGCMSRAEHAAWRDGFYRGSSTIRAEHKDFSASIASDNNRDGVVDALDESVEPTPLPTETVQGLTPEQRNLWYQERLRTHAELDRTYEQDRSHDGGILGRRSARHWLIRSVRRTQASATRSWRTPDCSRT